MANDLRLDTIFEVQKKNYRDELDLLRSSSSVLIKYVKIQMKRGDQSVSVNNS